MENTRLTLTHGGVTVTTELKWDASFKDILAALHGEAVAVTFTSEGVIDAMKQYAEDHTFETEKYDECYD